MADIDNSREGPGFKLFGTRIPLELKHTKNEPVTEIETSVALAKRPDRTIPCPRCKSMETKFCYFNNYNVNQPRHFCKGCQRYWTAGGTLRNVPVGAGRRKTKPFYQDTIGFSNESIFEDFHGVVEQWHLEASSGGLSHVFTPKRRCTG
ncbi:hypothetical protein GIB67_032075 [Kingdonia uniflora]|uniref:Dof-type domain-containing protein n=1 Tax=Kingdonia uniflora TaxID=39325 RepID=A0A7J7MWV1_9MAGN|nr:hypothetical protein GIB67_032075 [Kingdonia uniflora]